MIKQKKILVEEHIPEFAATLARLPECRRAFVDRSIAIAHGMMLWKQGREQHRIEPIEGSATRIDSGTMVRYRPVNLISDTTNRPPIA